jgi:hypothetical protein
MRKVASTQLKTCHLKLKKNIKLRNKKMSIESIYNSVKPIITTCCDSISRNTPSCLKDIDVKTVALEQVEIISNFVSKNMPESIKSSKTTALILSNLEKISGEVSKRSPKIIKENPVIVATSLVFLSIGALKGFFRKN